MMHHRPKWWKSSISYHDISRATNNFAPENLIEVDDLEEIYEGELLVGKNHVKLVFEVLNERFGGPKYSLSSDARLLFTLEHENIVSVLAFYDDSRERVLVHEFVKHGSLEKYLGSAELTWLKRVQICVGAARGLYYLQNASTKIIPIQVSVKSTGIMLDENWQAKISFQILPKQRKSEIQTEASNIYAFGTVLFEVLCGKPRITSDRRNMRYLNPRNEQNNKINFIIDPNLRRQMHKECLNAFSAITSQCVEEDQTKRPTMIRIIEELEKVYALQRDFEKAFALQQIKGLEHWIIPLEDIRKATNNFHVDYLIGWGGFGGVYGGELSLFDVRKRVVKNESDDLSMVEPSSSKVAVKRLDTRYGQGREQFLQEIKVLSGLHHQNLVPLLGFCDEDDEMILVYEYAPNGSLDKCIRNPRREYSHTWAQRLQICLDVAHGLGYLHENDIIHRDIKSANVLLGRNWEGMLGDFGLSRISKHADHEFTMTNVAGTVAYVHPNYARTGKLTKQSDIYSFGVLLLEVFCGRLAVLPKYGDDPEYILHKFQRHFGEKTVLESIDPYLVKEFEKGSPVPESFRNSIDAFSEIAYKCLYDYQVQNLSMADVVTGLKKAWMFHETGVENSS